MSAQAVEQGVELVEVREVADADGAAADLVLISRADAAAGGSDLGAAGRILTQRIEVAVDGEDERAGFRQAKHVGLDPDALAAQLLDFLAQPPGVEDHAIADDRQRAGDDAARQQGELVDLVTDDQRVAGVVPALEAHHAIGAAGEPVDDLALALVAPLGADHGNVTHA